MTLHWIVQGMDSLREEGHTKLVELLERLGTPYTNVKVVPFSHEITPEPNCGDHAIVMGSTTLVNEAVKRNWTPGAFFNEHFDYRSYMDHYGVHMLNDRAIICEFGKVESPWERFFLRPTADLKQFSGMIIEQDEATEWAERVKAIEQKNYTTITSDTPVVVAPIREIFREYRFFIVDGKVVTGSLYKRGDKVIYDPDTRDADSFAQRMADIWCPDEAFVLDVALTSTGFRVLEVNCFNSAGYYAADVQKIYHAIEEKFG